MSQNLGSFKLAKLLQNNVLLKILWDFFDVCLNAPEGVLSSILASLASALDVLAELLAQLRQFEG